MSLPGRFLTCALVLLLVLCGCRTIERADPRKRAAQEHSEQVRKLQLEVMRFADEYAGRTRESVNRFQSGLQSADERLLTQNWKVQQAGAAYTIASGPNPVSNALDMVVLASLSRMVIHDSWKSEGERAANVQETYRSLEAEAWGLVDGVLTPEQVATLHQTITQWRARNPNVQAVAYIHFRDFAQGVGPGDQNNAGTASILSIVGIDPLSNLDPAVQEIAQTRQLAERAIYYVQRAPDLLDMQVERISYQFAVMPETRSLLTSVDRVSLIGSSSDRLVDNLPKLLDHEREALVAQLTDTLNSQSATLGTLAGQLRTALQAGTDTATAVNGALQTFERISGQFTKKPGPASEPPRPPGPPFDIRQYTAMLEQAALTMRELENLAQRGDVVVPALRSATQDAGSQVRSILDHLFVLLVVLVVFIALAALAVALAYRRITMRFARAA
jgi:hypothetical protein